MARPRSRFVLVCRNSLSDCNVQYIAPHVRQLKQPGYSAWLVRGDDRHGHYAEEILARTDLDPAALERHRAQQRVHRETVATD